MHLRVRLAVRCRVEVMIPQLDSSTTASRVSNPLRTTIRSKVIVRALPTPN
jgi:hypothetical protein